MTATSRRCGQASLESTVAIFCSLLLLLATMKVFFWFAERIVRRQQYYENTRGDAGRQTSIAAQNNGPIWNDPNAFDRNDMNSTRRLRILKRSQ